MKLSQRWTCMWILVLAGCGDDAMSAGGGGQSTATSTGGSAGGLEGGSGMGGAGGAGGAGGEAQLGVSCDPPSGALPELVAGDLGLVLDEPVQIRSPPGRPDTLFVVERSGAIRIVEAGAVRRAPFLDLGAQIRLGPEEGLLGLAFHPGYAQNGRLFVHYSKAVTGASTVEEYVRSADDQDRAEPAAAGLVLSEPTAQPNHNGGALEFGPDGLLYISLGDGGGANDPECDAQSGDNLLGKILRVDVDQPGYPAGSGNPAGSRIWHNGLRNPWRMSFDPCSGDLYVGDVGQGMWEEIDVASANDGALNFGWPLFEGDEPFPNDCVAAPASVRSPLTSYDHATGCSVTGGLVYRGNDLPALRGAYLYGDFCTGAVWMLRAVDGALVEAPLFTGVTVDNLVAFGEDGRGELYLASLSGDVFRLRAAQ